MSVLYKEEIVRRPGKFTQQEIQKLAFLSHDENRQSATIKKWCEIGKKNYQEMIGAMNAFLKSDEAIKSIEQFPKDILPCIQYTFNNPDTFNTVDFLKETNFRNLKNEIKIMEDGCVDPKSSIAILMERCADTALAIHKTKNFINKKFDVTKAFKALNLLKDSYSIGKKEFKLNGRDYMQRPFVLNIPCIQELDPCLIRIPKPNGEETDDTINKEDDCPCKKLQAKEKGCNCEETKTDPCECKCDDTCHDQNPCCAKNIELYVTDLFLVKDEVKCYKPGEIALIENIMMGEERVKKHRHLQREETYTEVEEENNTYNERDTQIDERFSLHKEIDKVVDTDLSVNAGAEYSSRTGRDKGTKREFSASVDASFNQSRNDAKKMVQDESKNVISRAIEKVEKKLRTLSTRRMINEIEERNKHVFDGRSFTENKNGIYFFVNQERHAQVYNYGCYTMLDLYVPDPSKRLQALLEKKFDLKKPEKPCIKIEEINPDDFLDYVQCYGFIDLDAPPVVLPDIIKEVSINIRSDNRNWQKEQNFVIPEGYKAIEIWLPNEPAINPASGSRNVTFTFGGQSLKDYGSGQPNNDVRGPLTVNVLTTDDIIIIADSVKEVRATIKIKLTPIEPVDFLPWKLDVFNRIMEKYQKELDEYNKALEEFNKSKENKFNQNPFMLSEMIMEQLKHSALEYLSCQFFNEKNGMRNRVKPCGYPEMDIRETEEFSKKVSFWEHSIQWKFMSYMLYPYFWAEKCSWDDKLQEEAQNGLFQKFLQSGYARISLAVRPGFEADIRYYLDEGELWSGAGLPSYGDPNYLPIHQEIKESKDNFNADRKGYLIWESTFTPSLQKDQIIVKSGNSDPVEYLDNIPLITIPPSTTPVPNPNFGLLDPIKVSADINRIVVIDCIEYRIVSIDLINGEVILTLDRDLEHKDPAICPNDFDNRYKDRNKLWSTGAKFEGAPWAFMVPTSLTWLKEDECLPCYPIKCTEKC